MEKKGSSPEVSNLHYLSDLFYINYVRPFCAMFMKNIRKRLNDGGKCLPRGTFLSQATIFEILSPFFAVFIATLIYNLIDPSTVATRYPDNNINTDLDYYVEKTTMGTADFWQLPQIKDMYTTNQAWCSSDTLVSTCDGDRRCAFNAERTDQMRWFEIKSGLHPNQSKPFNITSLQSEDCHPTFIAIAPATDTTILTAEANKLLNFANHGFESLSSPPFVSFISQGELEAWIQARDYDKKMKLSSAIIVNAGYPNWDFTFRYNRTIRAWQRRFRLPRTYDPKFDTSLKNNEDGFDGGGGGPPMRSFIESWTSAGYFQLADIVSSFSSSRACEENGICTNNERINVTTTAVVGFPFEKYEDGAFWAEAGGLVVLVLIFGLIYQLTPFISALGTEKEKKVREGMLMMGLSPIVFWLSTIIDEVLILVPSAFLMTAYSLTAILQYSDFSYIFISFFLFGLSSVFLYIFISSLFFRSRSSTICANVVFFAGIILNGLLFDSPRDSSTPFFAGLYSIHPVVTFQFMTTIFEQFEDSREGITTDTVSSPVEQCFDYSLTQIWGLCIRNLFIYSALSWYASEIIPSEYGTNRPWYFLFTKSYWSETITNIQKMYKGLFVNKAKARVHSGVEYNSTNDSDKEVELSDNTATNIDTARTYDTADSLIIPKVGVSVRQLRKVFKTATGEKVAVNALTLDMVAGDVTVLLGHNGAGKTTTLSMLTGLVSPTEGEAYVNGLSITDNMDIIRQNIGVCPQHDVLFDDSTVEEHLHYFGAIKKIPLEKMHEEVDMIIRVVGLTEKRHVQSKLLSGGQKRKLSIGIAFIGGSKTVFLDEPTSGMDPYSRRFTWDLIRRMRSERCIILTTHFMDEADLLGDRIGIMGDGELICHGTALQLKRDHGIGYNITIEKKTKPEGAFKPKETEKVITNMIHGANLLTDAGGELSYQLPFEAADKFGSLLNSLESQRETLGIESCGLSMTTLEEVFIRVTHAVEERRRITALAAEEAAAQGTLVSTNGAAIVPTNESNSIDNDTSTSKPNTITETNETNSETVNDTNNTNVSAVAVEDADLNETFVTKETSTLEAILLHVQVMYFKRYLMLMKDRVQVLLLVVIPVGIFMLAALLSKYYVNYDVKIPEGKVEMNSFNPDHPSLHFPMPYTASGQYCDYCEGDPECFTIRSYLIETTNSLGGLCKWTDEDSYVEIASTPASAKYEVTLFGNALDILNIPVTTSSSISNMSHYLLDNKDIYASSTYGAVTIDKLQYMNISGTSYPANLEYIIHTNFTSMYASQMVATTIADTLIKSFDSSGSINTRMHPFENTRRERNHLKAYERVSTTNDVIISIIYLPAMFSNLASKERETKAKYQQLLSGVSITSYWFGTYLWDMTTSLPYFFVFMVFCWTDILELEELDDSDAKLAMCLIYILYISATAGYAYCNSLFFKSPTTCLFYTFCACLFMGFFGGLTGFILRILDLVGIIDINYLGVWRHIAMLFPSYCLFDGLTCILLKTRFEDGELDPGETYNIFDWELTGAPITFLIIDFILAISLLLFCEYDIKSYILNSIQPGSHLIKHTQEEAIAAAVTKDEDVKEHEALIADPKKIIEDKNGTILLKDIHKKYENGKYAVRGMSLEIPRGECFGLLGINGAGKSTTLALLCGETYPSDGIIYIDGMELSSNLHACRRKIGFCRQFDALFHKLSGREHLEIYAKLKGIPSEQIHRAVESKLKALDLVEYADRDAGTYSGGNKRKLSVAIAMIGDPSIVFLDEPSTGMDPVTRRSMWQLISDAVTTKGNCSVILTTHSMEEAEALCTRLGIMVGGTLRCLGSCQHLRSRYGKGYQIDIEFEVPSPKKITEKCTSLINSSNSSTHLKSDSILDKNQLNSLLSSDDSKRDLLMDRIQPQGSGASIFNRLAGNICTLDAVAEWLILEDLRDKFHVFITSTYGDYIIHEEQYSTMRIEIANINKDQTKRSVGDIFEVFHRKKQELSLTNFSLNETTLEQIFNQFASQQEEETLMNQ